MLHVASHVVAQSLKPMKVLIQQLPIFLLFCDHPSVAQQCWIHFHSSSNIVWATHAYYARITKTYGLYSSHDALQVSNLLGVVASVCTPLPTRTQQLPTLLGVVAPVCTQLKAGQSFSGSQSEHASSSSHIIQLQDLTRSALLFLSCLASFKNCKLSYYWLHNTKIQVFRVIKTISKNKAVFYVHNLNYLKCIDNLFV